MANLVHSQLKGEELGARIVVEKWTRHNLAFIVTVLAYARRSSRGSVLASYTGELETTQDKVLRILVELVRPL